MFLDLNPAKVIKQSRHYEYCLVSHAEICYVLSYPVLLAIDKLLWVGLANELLDENLSCTLADSYLEKMLCKPMLELQPAICRLQALKFLEVTKNPEGETTYTLSLPFAGLLELIKSMHHCYEERNLVEAQ